MDRHYPHAMPRAGRLAARGAEGSGALIAMFLLVVSPMLVVGWSLVRELGISAHPAAAIARGLRDAPASRQRPGYDPGSAAAVVAAAPQEPAVPVAAPPAAPAVPAVQPTPAGASGDRLRIANTDGAGVALRSAPRDDTKVPRGLLEGARVTVLAREGTTWAQVRGENGLEGWVPTRYLAPAN